MTMFLLLCLYIVDGLFIQLETFVLLNVLYIGVTCVQIIHYFYAECKILFHKKMFLDKACILVYL